jgi:hypothetical protein
MIRVNFIKKGLNILLFIFVAQQHELQGSYAEDPCEKRGVTMLQMLKSI